LKIYTGFGDKGKTALLGGKVVSKSDSRVHLYGTLDELNSFLGLLLVNIQTAELKDLILELQNEIFVLSSEIAAGDEKMLASFKDKIGAPQVDKLEAAIDRLSDKIPPLKKFILPGGSEAAAVAHIARTVCRRAERLWVELNAQDPLPFEQGVYLNRLSDLLFVVARYLNVINGTPEITWQGLR